MRHLAPCFLLPCLSMGRIKPSKARWGTPEWKAYQLGQLGK